MRYFLGVCNFEWVDGELRYLKVNDQEIIRRIYFTVRYAEWNTAIGSVLSTNITSHSEDEIEIKSRVLFEAPGIKYIAQIKLIFSAKGNLTYEVEGATEQGSSSIDIRRTGICILLGAREFASLPFELQSSAETNFKGVFTDLIEPEVRLPTYNSLITTSPAGGILDIAIKNECFGLEDQRTFNDNSWKLFSGLPHKYPDLLSDDVASEIVQISFDTSQPLNRKLIPQHHPLDLDASASFRLPKVISVNSSSPNKFFSTSRINESTTMMTWSFTPLVNLDDEATIWENVSTVIDQARTARASLEGRKITLKIDSTSLRPLAVRLKGAAHASSALAGAFVVSMIEQLAMAGIEEVSFSGFSAQVEEILRTFNAQSGTYLTPLTFALEQPSDVDGFLLKQDSIWEVWIANKTKMWRDIPIDPILMNILQIEQVNSFGQWQAVENVRQEHSKILTIEPYQVLRVRIKSNEETLDL